MSKQSWFIAIEIPEPVKADIEEIKKQIAHDYETLSVLKSPAHITIVPPFYWGNGEELGRVVQSFSFTPFVIYLDGYDAFESKVVFIKIQNHEPLRKLYEAFNTYFYHHYPQLKRKPTFAFHPHITVGNRDWKPENFRRCVHDFAHQVFMAEVICARLTLYTLVEGKWVPFNAAL